MSQTATYDAWVKTISGGEFDPQSYPKRAVAPAAEASELGAGSSGSAGMAKPSGKFPTLTAIFADRDGTSKVMELFDHIITVNSDWCLKDHKKTKVSDAIGPIYHQLLTATHAVESACTAGRAEVDSILKAEGGSFFLWLSDHLKGSANAHKAADGALKFLDHAGNGLVNARKDFGDWHFRNGYQQLCIAVSLIQQAGNICLQWSDSAAAAAETAATTMEYTRDLCLTALAVLAPMTLGAEAAPAAIARVGLQATAGSEVLKGVAHVTDAYFAGKPVPWGEIGMDILLGILFKGFEEPIKKRMLSMAEGMGKRMIASLMRHGVGEEGAKAAFEKTVTYLTAGGQGLIKEVAKKIFPEKPKSGEANKETMRQFVTDALVKGAAEEIINDLIKGFAGVTTS